MINKDTVLIVNPNSNSGMTGKNWEFLYQTLCESFGKDLEVAFTKKSGDGTELSRAYLKKGFKNIIPIGGDGMINEVANGFFENSNEINYNFNIKIQDGNNDYLSSLPLKPINPEAIMTILPSGTRNVLIQSLDLPNDFKECCNALGNCKTYKKIDVIAALVTDPENTDKNVMRIFLNAAEIGIGAEIISKAKDIRNKVNNRLLSTIAGLITTVPTFKSDVCEITVGLNKESGVEDKVITKMTMGIVANGRFLGGGVQAATNAKINDGLLDIVIIRNSDGLGIINEIINMKIEDQSQSEDSGSGIGGNNIYYTQSKNVSIATTGDKNIIVTLDGEPAGVLPAFFKVFPNYLNVRI
jgi:diacylglycerol kinase family enzyme